MTQPIANRVPARQLVVEMATADGARVARTPDLPGAMRPRTPTTPIAAAPDSARRAAPDQPRPSELAAHDRKLMAEYKDLKLLVLARAQSECEEPKHHAHRPVGEGSNHATGP